MTRKLADEVAHPVERARQSVRDAILLRVPDAQAAGVLAALAVGDQAAIERDDWDLFRHTGVAHLMSISGLHVTMFAWLAAALIGLLWRRSSRLMLALPAPLAARWGGVLAAAALCAAGRLGRAGAAHAVDAGHGGAAAQPGVRWPQPLVLLAAAVRGDAARPLGADAAGLLAVVRRGGSVDGLGAGRRAAAPQLRRRAAGRGWRRRCAPVCAPRWWPASAWRR